MLRKCSTMWFVGFDGSDSNAVKHGMIVETLDFSRSLSVEARGTVVSISRHFSLSANSLRVSTRRKVGCLFDLITPNYFCFPFKGHLHGGPSHFACKQIITSIQGLVNSLLAALAHVPTVNARCTTSSAVGDSRLCRHGAGWILRTWRSGFDSVRITRGFNKAGNYLPPDACDRGASPHLSDSKRLVHVRKPSRRLMPFYVRLYMQIKLSPRHRRSGLL